MAKADHEPLHRKDPPPGTDLPPKQRTCTGYTICKLLVIVYAIFFQVKLLTSRGTRSQHRVRTSQLSKKVKPAPRPPLFKDHLLTKLIGLLLLCVGIWIIGLKTNYESINDLVTSPAILAILVGICMLIFGLFGFIGAVREHLCLLKTFLAVVIIVFLIQVIVGIVAFVYREETSRTASQQLMLAVESYHRNEEVRDSVDYVQRQWACCGLDGPNDWERNENFSCASFGPNACGVPISCCRIETQTCGSDVRRVSTKTEDIRKKGVNTNGCERKFAYFVEKHLDIVGAITLGFAIPQILGIFLVYVFIQKVEDRIFLFRYRKRIYEE